MNRKLDPSERLVWNRVARTVSPRLKPTGKKAARQMPSKEDFSAMMRLPPLKVAKTQAPTGAVPQNTDRQVRRGQVEIDSRIDLHGMTQDQARRALATHLFRAAKRGQSCVLVITGKGPRLEGVLRTALPRWLGDGDLRPLITTFAPAHVRHGGSGAWYVFLRGA